MASSNAHLEHGTFAKYKALVFDCYGTLIDWESGIYVGLRPLFRNNGKRSDRQSALHAFSSVERELQARHPSMLYSDLLAKVYLTLEARLQNRETPPDALRDDTAGQASVAAPAYTETGTESVRVVAVGTSDTAQGGGNGPADSFAQSVETWPEFEDTIPALAALSKRFKLVVLSNIDRATIAKTRKQLEGPGGFAFDAVYTAEEVGAYKPAPEMLSYALARLQSDFGIAPEEVLMTAQSVFHDILPAKARGIATSWINRENVAMGLDETKGNEATFVFPTLGAMADAVEKSSI